MRNKLKKCLRILAVIGILFVSLFQSVIVYAGTSVDISVVAMLLNVIAVATVIINNIPTIKTVYLDKSIFILTITLR